jgi:hypothetical protein
MLLIILLGLIAKFTSVYGDCNIGTTDVEDFHYNKLGVWLLTRFMKQAALKLLLVFIFHLCFHSLSLNRTYQIAYVRVIEIFRDSYLLMS